MERKIPFEIEAPMDPFYFERNLMQLQKAGEQIANGKVVTKTLEELERLADES